MGKRDVYSYSDETQDTSSQRHANQRHRVEARKAKRNRRDALSYGGNKATREANERAEAAGLFVVFNPKTGNA